MFPGAWILGVGRDPDAVKDQTYGGNFTRGVHFYCANSEHGDLPKRRTSDALGEGPFGKIESSHLTRTLPIARVRGAPRTHIHRRKGSRNNAQQHTGAVMLYLSFSIVVSASFDRKAIFLKATHAIPGALARSEYWFENLPPGAAAS